MEAGDLSRGFEGCIQVCKVESRKVARFPHKYFRASGLGAALANSALMGLPVCPAMNQALLVYVRGVAHRRAGPCPSDLQ